jgi:hypothetical protein
MNSGEQQLACGQWPRRRAAWLSAAATALAVAGCGGAHNATSASGTGQAKPTLVNAVASPANALAPATLGPAGLAKLVRVQPGRGQGVRGLANLPITQAIPAISTRLNQFWSQEFARSGIRWEMVLEMLVRSSPVKTPCSSTISPTDQMYLCIGDAAGDTFYWTVPWMRQNVDTGAGRMNLALGMAALYSDVPLDLFGFKDRVSNGVETNSQWQQQKFCLTGVYAASLTERKLVQRAGLQTIDNYLSTSGGSGAATRQQLGRAFRTGFASGTPGTCARPNAGTGA